MGGVEEVGWVVWKRLDGWCRGGWIGGGVEEVWWVVWRRLDGWCG